MSAPSETPDLPRAKSAVETRALLLRGGVAAVLVGAAAGGLGAGALVIAGVAFTAFVHYTVSGWRLALRQEEDLAAPLRSVLRAMDRLRTGDGLRRSSLPIGGGGLARALTRRWNEAAARIAEGERDAQSRVIAAEMGRSRLQIVLDTIQEAVLVIDASSEVTLANPAALRALGCNAADVTARRLEELTSGELRDRLRQALQTVRQKPQRPVEVDGLSHRGRVYNATALAAGSADSEFEGVVLVLTDITQSGEIRRAKDKFLSSMSHELRTPLTSICCYSELLKGMVPGSDMEWPEFVDVIHREGLRLAELVDAVLDYARIEADEVHWTFTDVDMVKVCTEVCEGLDSTARRSQIALRLDRDDRDCTVYGDRDRLVQAITHLVSNAIKFSPANAQALVSVSRDGPHVRVRVEDGGFGVPEHMRETIFERFHQPMDHLTSKPQGLGLGLPIARRIVEQHRGELRCDDSPLGGARFQFSLPLAEAGRVALDSVDPGVAGRRLSG